MPLHELPDELWHGVLGVNLNAAFYLSKRVLPAMVRQRGPDGPPGVILNMSSVQGLQSQKGVPAYAASKGALLALTRQMAMDYGEQGVRPSQS